MTTLPDASIEVRYRWACGCVERWYVSRVPDDEPIERSAPEEADCDPLKCLDCADVVATPRGCRCPNGRREVEGRPLVEARRITLRESDGPT